MQVKPAILYTDVISPYAYLMDALLRRSPPALDIELRPVLFAGLLNAHQSKGPAEIARKRIYTYEFCTWLAHSRGIAFQMPSAHPFNPIRYLRLIIALGNRREVASAVFDALFTTGDDPEAPATWQRLARQLGIDDPEPLIEAPTVKLQLRQNTDAAIAAGVFGVPTLLVGDRLFWGVDSLPMLAAYLADDGSLDTPQMLAARQVRVGTTRNLPKPGK